MQEVAGTEYPDPVDGVVERQVDLEGVEAAVLVVDLEPVAAVAAGDVDVEEVIDAADPEPGPAVELRQVRAVGVAVLAFMGFEAVAVGLVAACVVGRGLVATEYGLGPTPTDAITVRVARSITDTVPDVELVTYRRVPEGFTATPRGPAPTGMVAVTVWEGAAMIDTVPLVRLAT